MTHEQVENILDGLEERDFVSLLIVADMLTDLGEVLTAEGLRTIACMEKWPDHSKHRGWIWDDSFGCPGSNLPDEVFSSLTGGKSCEGESYLVGHRVYGQEGEALLDAANAFALVALDKASVSGGKHV